MKFHGSKRIEKPRSEVVKYFADPAFLGEYQDGFVSKELISGKQGEEGAVSKMIYKHGNRELELIETIVSNNLPEMFLAHYHHEHMDNTMKCTFIALDDHSMLYKYEFEYTRINWIMPRLFAILSPGMYKKQGEKWMKQFKEFVEKQ